MQRKELRRLERRHSLRKRILAGGTAALIALGMSVGGTAPAFATPPSGGLPTPVVDAGGQTTYQQGGLVCDSSEINFSKPGALDSPNLDSSGSYTAPSPDAWGSLSWNAGTRTVTWSINAGWDVDICIKGGTYLTVIDTSEFSGTSYTHSYAGLSHAGFNVVSEPVFDFDWEYAAPTCTGITIEFPANLPEGQQGLIEVNVEFDFGTLQYKLEGSDYALAFPDGHAGATVTLTWSQFRNGSVPNGPYTIEWVQVHGTNYHWTGTVTCGDLPTEELVEPTASSTPMTCDTDGSYTLDDVEGVVWYVAVTALNGTANDDDFVQADPDTYEVDTEQTVHVRAELESDDYGFGLETQTEWTFDFERPEDCLPPPCIPDEYISYTYDNTNNTGVVTVEQPQGYDDQLCAPLYVTAAAWAFDRHDNQWTQTLVVANEINGGVAITEPGTYPYGAPVGCGQGDIYASRTAFPVPSPYLNGPNNPAWPDDVTPWPFVETFLHSMGFDGPNPTYMVTQPGCNVVEPVAPDYTAIDECGEYGSLTLDDSSPYISYIVRDDEGTVVDAADAQEGTFTVTAVAAFPYLLSQNYPEGGWTVELGEYYECPVEIAPVPVASECDEQQGLGFDLPAMNGVTWFVNGVERSGFQSVTAEGDYVVTFEIDTNADGGPYALAPGAEEEFTFSYTAADLTACDPPVLPVTNAQLAFLEPTCELGQRLDPENYVFDDELAEHVSTLVEGSNYTVVFRILDSAEDAVFDQSPDVTVDGRDVTDEGKTLTFTGTLDGVLTGEECDREIEVVDPYGVTDTCLDGARYYVRLIEGIEYTITVNGGTPTVISWEGTNEQVWFDAEAGDVLNITAAATEGFTLAPQPGPLDHTFEVWPEECLPTLPLVEGSVTFTPATCLDSSNWVTLDDVEGVQWWVNGTAVDAGRWPMPTGDVEVEATALDGYGFGAETQTAWEYTFAAVDDSTCDVDELAVTGASNALVGTGIAALLITLAGVGVVIGRRVRQEA